MTSTLTPPTAAPAPVRYLEVVAPGPFATVQDLGRPGLAALGVSASGAADTDSLRLANRLVGNPETFAGVEVTFGGLDIRFGHGTVVALTGADCPVWMNGHAAGVNAPFWVPPGARLTLGLPRTGLRTYLAVRGGVDVEPVLHSRATDTLSGLGPAPLAPGTVLPVGRTPLPLPAVDLAPRPAFADQPTLRIIPGPRADWFDPGAVDALRSAPYVVGADSNRIGLRLTGPVLRHRSAAELPPEPMAHGALQVPPNGQPILFLADHPVTGGYPVIAVVAEADLPTAAQLQPGRRIRFRATTPRP